jgi:hypothetical protein
VRVGYGEADATWRVGAGSGQYTEKDLDEDTTPESLTTDSRIAHLVNGEEVDPFGHAWNQHPSYGVQSRLSIRAIVVEGSNRKRAAFVKLDNYLAADALARRAAQILDASGTSGIHYADIMQMATHNHSSPFYFSPSFGVWLFQDVFDLRAFEYEARQMALAIERAAADLRPARMGATVVRHTIYKGNIARATLGDDGTPAGYPEQRAGAPVIDKRADFGMSVVRFDEVPSGRPIAILVNHGQHPESNDGYDLISADFLAPVQRMIERDLGSKVVWSQGDVGSAEGPYCSPGGPGGKDKCFDVSANEVLPDGVVRAWAHVGHAQAERGARYLADSVEEAYAKIGTGRAIVPFTTDFPIVAGNAWVPGPVSHPYPSVSNCRTETTAEGNHGVPILGVPDCERLGDTDQNNMVWEQLKAAGLPLPEHYDAPSFAGVEENMRIHLQAFRMGEVVLASCACEAQMDLILNFESRANKTQGDIYDGYEYPCTQNANMTWTCKAGANLTDTVTITDAKHARMVAQIHNDARGWEDPSNALASNAEPADPSEILGNFTKEELPASSGYALPIGVGHAGDYNGYVVSYREYMIRDHYRKALTPYGPHTADYMVTRMVRLAASLKPGGAVLTGEPLEPLAVVDEQREQAFATALGQISSAVYEAWMTGLPSDAGPAAIVAQPKNITRFQAATFSWRGGSNANDNPVARVERLVGGRWRPFADQSGEVQTMVAMPSGASGVIDAYSGNQEWIWTANFEAFDAFPRTVVPGGQTPTGTYRFVVDGAIRLDAANEPYHFVSHTFTVSPWKGITVTNAKRAKNGSVSFSVAPVAYPRTYPSLFRFISDDKNPSLCRTCSFRPWARSAQIVRVVVRVVHANGRVENMVATRSGDRWVVRTKPSDKVTIEPGGVHDAFGETNAARVTF